MTDEQIEKLRKYLDDDCQAHLAAPHGRWRLDGGKLRAALEAAGVEVPRPRPQPPLMRQAVVNLEFNTRLPSGTDLSQVYADISVSLLDGDGKVLAELFEADGELVSWVN